MKSFAESVTIAANPERVWQALTTPTEVVCWDTGIIRPLDAPLDYPKPGQHVRWQYRLGPLPLVLHDHPTRVETTSTFASSIRLVTAELSLTSRLPIIGTLLERVVGEPLARSTVQTSLAAIKRHCEDRSSSDLAMSTGA